IQIKERIEFKVLTEQLTRYQSRLYQLEITAGLSTQILKKENSSTEEQQAGVSEFDKSNRILVVKGYKTGPFDLKNEIYVLKENVGVNKIEFNKGESSSYKKRLMQNSEQVLPSKETEDIQKQVLEKKN